MGVPGFFKWLLDNKKKLKSKNLIRDNINKKVKYLMLDTNCLLHPCVNTIKDNLKKDNLKKDNLKKDNNKSREQIENNIFLLIETRIIDMIEKVNPEYIYIAIDGVAPIAKILQQRQRRHRYLYDTQIKLKYDNLNEKIDNITTDEIVRDDGITVSRIPISSIELTPGTEYMERINERMIELVKKIGEEKKIKYVYSSYHVEGEGEHKILQYIRKNVKSEETIVIYGLDADLLFLALSLGIENNLYIMREKAIFQNKTLEIEIENEVSYNYVEINELHLMINKLNIKTNDFIMLCYLVGNDFIPGLLTTDIKRNGLDKIISSYEEARKIINKEIIEKNKEGKLIINYDLVIEIFKKLEYTEWGIWKNINREKHPKNDIEKQKDLDKFILGSNMNTECLEKIEFSGETEYYNYYLGINDSVIDNSIIKKMVKDYITGMEWCINYYLDECKSWSWGYNFMIAPLIKDIVKYFPKNIKLENDKRVLCPVEQLLLAIPIDTYKYVISNELITKIQHNKEIGYMFPKSYDIDINKESLLWKCQVKIPMVEYIEYIKNIKLINIVDIKNTIQEDFCN
jgi:5'-3' exonuclease